MSGMDLGVWWASEMGFTVLVNEEEEKKKFFVYKEKVWRGRLVVFFPGGGELFLSCARVCDFS